MAKRALCLLLAAVSLLSLAVPALAAEAEPAAATATSGNCGPMVDGVPGDSVKWSLDESTGTLTISGTGPMGDFNSANVPYGQRLVRDVTRVVIDEGVTSIGSNAFVGCTYLRDVTIPGSVTSIGAYAFELCENLTHIDIPSGVKSIGRTAFAYCYGLESAIIPDSVTSIREEAFRDCSSLADITFSANLTDVGGSAFDGTPWLAAQGDFVVMNGWLFRYQGTAASATAPDTVKRLSGQSSFNTTTLRELIVPKTVTYIGNDCFNECPNLRSVTVYNSKAEFGQLFDPSCPTAPRTLELASYSTSTAHTWVVSFGNRDHLTFRDLGPEAKPEPTPSAPTVTAKPTPAPPTKLATPKIAKMENTANGLKVTWGKVAGAERYMVFYKVKGAKSWTKIGSTTATSYTRAAAKLKSGTTYVFTIRCVKNDKTTYTSDYDKTGKSLTFYAAPAVKIAKVAGGIKVTWNRVTGSPRYMVYYKENGGSWKKIGTTASTTYTRKAANLKNGATYQFAVRCCQNDKKTVVSGYKASNGLRYKK